MSGSRSVKNIISKGPEFVKGTELDVFFQRLDDDLFKKLRALQNQDEGVVSLYTYLDFKGNSDFVGVLLGYISELHVLVLKSQKDIDQANTSLLPISLHDMRYVDALINLLIIHGIDANLPEDFRIPMDAKRLSQFKDEDRRYQIPKEHVIDKQTLALVVDAMFGMLQPLKEVKENVIQSDYLRTIILKGPAYTNVILASIFLISQGNDTYTPVLATLEQAQETYELFSIYTLLTQVIENILVKQKIMELLSTLPIRRSDGLISLVDFILGVRENEDIDTDKMSRVNQILLSKPPKGVPNKMYLEKIFEQIYDALTYVNRPILVSCVNNVIRDFFFRNKRIVRDFLFKRIYSQLLNTENLAYSTKEVNDLINVLISLSKNASLDVISDLVSGLDADQFYIELWTYALFLKQNQKVDPLVANNLKKDNIGPYYEVVLSLVKALMFQVDDYSPLNYISSHLLNTEHDGWEFKIDLETQLAYVSKRDELPDIDKLGLDNNRQGDNMNQMSKLFQDMDVALDLFMELLKLLDNDACIRDVFLSVLRRWIGQTSKESGDSSQLLHDNSDTQQRNITILLNIKLLEKMNENFSSGLINSVSDILDIANDLFAAAPFSTEEDADAADSDDEDSDDEAGETGPSVQLPGSTTSIGVLEELLDTILGQTPRGTLLAHREKLVALDKSLSSRDSDVSRRLRKDIANVLNDASTVPDDTSAAHSQDTQTLDKALRNLADPLTPIKVHGLSALRELVQSGSDVISMDRVLNLHLQYLKHPDPFVYLYVVKGLSSLCSSHAATVLVPLVEYYRDDQGKKNRLDDILKVGEVFMQYIERENELFTGKYANLIIDVCLERVREHTGTDNRIRMSALSILGVALQVNARGVSARIDEMLDCVFGVLQLETSTKEAPTRDDSFVMRRGAVRLVYDLFYDFTPDLLSGKYSAQRLCTLLEYVRTSDNDYLVCEQIDQVLKVVREHYPETA